MAYELRQVPASWQHPKDADGKHVPLYGEPFENAHLLWLAGDPMHPSDEPEPEKCDLGAPKRGTYVPFSAAEATHYQVYEDTTEGTPISPVLASKEDVVAWLVREAIRPEDAAAFVEIGSVPTKVTFADGTQLRGFATAALILKGRRRQTGAAS